MYIFPKKTSHHCCFIECELHHIHNTEKNIKFLEKERSKETDGRWLKDTRTQKNNYPKHDF